MYKVTWGIYGQEKHTQSFDSKKEAEEFEDKKNDSGEWDYVQLTSQN